MYRVVAKDHNEKTYRWIYGPQGLVTKLIHATKFEDAQQAIEVRNFMEHHHPEYTWKIKRFK